MNQELLYQWGEQIGASLGLQKRQAKRLAVFSAGVVWSERCTLSKVADRLAGVLGIQMDSVERRLQRTLDDPKLKRTDMQRAWAKWVLRVLSRVDSVSVDNREREYVILVDETKLGEHLNVMLVGLAYQSRCIPMRGRTTQCRRRGRSSAMIIILAQLHQHVYELLLSWIASSVCSPIRRGTQPNTQGEVGDPQSVEYAASALNWLIFGTAMQAQIAKTKQPPEQWAQQMLALVTPGLRIFLEPSAER